MGVILEEVNFNLNLEKSALKLENRHGLEDEWLPRGIASSHFLVLSDLINLMRDLLSKYAKGRYENRDQLEQYGIIAFPLCF